MRNGYNIVIGGAGFAPEKFINDNLKPDCIVNDQKDNFIEFNDYEENQYSLDMVAEAMFFLSLHKDYFLSFKKDINIEYKVVNFFIECDFESLDFSNEQIQTLNDLGFTISFDFTNPKTKIT